MTQTARNLAVQQLDEGVVITKAALRAAERLGLPNRVLAVVLGVSEATVSRMGSGTYLLKPGDKAFELAVLFLRLFRALDSIVAGDAAARRAWLKSENAALGAAPVTLITTVAGLVNVVGYLDARRAQV